MFLIKWIKEYFGLFLLGLLLIAMLSFTVISPSGFSGFLLWIGLIFSLSLIWSFLCFSILGPLYIIAIRPGLTIAVKVPVIILRIVLHLFIVIPIKFMGQSSTWLWNGFEGSVGNIVTEDEETGRKKPKLKYVVVFLIFLLGLVYVVGVDFQTFSSMMRDATILAIPLMFIPLILTIIISGIGLKINGVSFRDVAEETYDDRINRIDQAEKIGENAVGIYKDLDHINKHKKAIKNKGGVKEAAKQSKTGQKAANIGTKADTIVANSKWLTRIAGSLDELPIIGGRLAGMLAGVSGGTAIAALIVILIVLIIVWLFVALIFIILFGGIMYVTVFPFLESAFGVAGSYGADIGGVVDTGPSADLNSPSPELNALKLAGARVRCMLQGPQCLREWQYNNTQRPGSESVGTEFSLDIEDFTVNSGLTLDISIRNQDDSIPIQFDVYNPIKNLRGIEARNVQYRVAIDGGPTTSCVSDWKDLGGQFVGDTGNSIVPGGFARPTEEIEDLTLRNCGALQPGFGQNMQAELQIKYDYSSQSTLQFEAMERGYMIEEGLRPEPKQSETANTPVMTYVNIQSPVTFRTPEDGSGREPIVFPMRAGFETDRFDLEYQIQPDDMKIYSSDLLADVDEVSPNDFSGATGGNGFGGSCSDLESGVDNTYRLSEEYKSSIIQSQEEDNNWYTNELGPSEANCVMVLAPDTINSISETGETLSVRVDGNYTVRISSTSKNFDVLNNRCGDPSYKCPLLVTKEESESMDGEISAECSTRISVDSTNGCTVIENTNSWASNPQVINDQNQLSNSIQNQKTAYDLQNLVDNRLDRDAPSGNPNNDISKFTTGSGDAYANPGVVGLYPDEVEEISDSGEGWILAAEESDSGLTASIQTVDRYNLCDSDQSSAETFAQRYSGYENIIYYSVPVTDCDDTLAERFSSEIQSLQECGADWINPSNIFTELREGRTIPESCQTGGIINSIEKCENEGIRVMNTANRNQECL